MHLAAVLGTPVVAIFRKGPPAVSARRWGPVGKNHLIIENDNLANIEVNEVINAVSKVLAR
jgi:ADP-heptose:LPS heptosyltransferase